MKVKQEAHDVGVIVGRFQVPELHDAHRALIDTVRKAHGKVVIFLGNSPIPSTRENPLDFESRKQMLLTEYPDVTVLYIMDRPSDERWSENLDRLVKEQCTPSQSAVLYGSRDSFIDRYMGSTPTIVLESDSYLSGTEIRREVSTRSVRGTPDFRAGATWAAFNRFPTCYPTVDVAIFDGDRMLLARKADEHGYRLIGGFADPRSDSYETDARREVLEESGIEISDPRYVGSFLVDDWRYRREVDKIKTLLFTANYIFGAPRAADDIVEVRWFKRAATGDFLRSIVVPSHRPLVTAALQAHRSKEATA